MRGINVALLAVAFAACTNSNSAGEDFNAAPPHAEHAAAFQGQTRAPVVESNVEIRVQELARGLNHPWAIEFLPDGQALVSERPGRLRIVSASGNVSAPVEGLPEVDARNQGGLLDVVLSPTFAADRLIYWSYSEPRGDGENGTSIARGRLSEDLTRVENVQVVFRQTPSWRSTGHYGSVLVFDGQGHLYVTLGDRQRGEARERAQDLSTHFGKVVRLSPDGSAAQGNPMSGRADAQAEIWSYGHRNQQGADIHPTTGELWTIEHGPRGGDELNVVRAGRNYGWPVISYGEEYSGMAVGAGLSAREGMEQPVYFWDPVIAPGDMDFYRGSLFPWRGDLLIAGLASRALVRVEIEGDRVVGEERFALDVGRIRDLEEAADGSIWIVTDEDNGRLLRLTPQ